MSKDISPWREHWNPGEEAYFEYHCWENHDSGDAELWYRSHSRVEILGISESDAPEDMNFNERCEVGHPKVYRVRFSDGFEGDAFEDELMGDESGFHRPDPPSPQT